MEYSISCKAFQELSVTELYEILRLRNEVFVVEQNCIFQDADNKDQKSYHLCIYQGDLLAAYSRLLPPGLSYTEPSIGRVVTSSSYRKSGIGKLLMNSSIEHCYKLFGKKDIHIGAQLYLKGFYKSFGFEQCSDVYDEDGIDHIEMLLKA